MNRAHEYKMDHLMSGETHLIEKTYSRVFETYDDKSLRARVLKMYKKDVPS